MLAALIVVAGCSSETTDTTTSSENTASSTTSAVPTPTTPTSEATESTLQDLVDRVAAEDSIPAVGATVFTSDDTLEQAMAGVRRVGDETAATVNDVWHLGSDTKAMTAALLGRLSEQGVLDFDVTLADAFSAIEQIDDGFRDVTLRQLLSHTAGIDDEIILASEVDLNDDAPLDEQRAAAASDLITEPPNQAPGEGFLYSNVGYVLAGAAMEEATGRVWEELITDEVFAPLGMSSCGFGAPGLGDDGDQPWGHDGANSPVEPGPFADNHPILGPAGTVHCTMDHWVLFLQEMMLALVGESSFLDQATAETIFAPVNEGYALGWGIFEQDGITAYTHDGSNTMWYASAWLVPEEDLGWVIVSNASIGPGGVAAQLVAEEIGDSYVPAP